MLKIPNFCLQIQKLSPEASYRFNFQITIQTSTGDDKGTRNVLPIAIVVLFTFFAFQPNHRELASHQENVVHI